MVAARCRHQHRAACGRGATAGADDCEHPSRSAAGARASAARNRAARRRLRRQRRRIFPDRSRAGRAVDPAAASRSAAGGDGGVCAAVRRRRTRATRVAAAGGLFGRRSDRAARSATVHRGDRRVHGARGHAVRPRVRSRRSSAAPTKSRAKRVTGRTRAPATGRCPASARCRNRSCASRGSSARGSLARSADKKRRVWLPRRGEQADHRRLHAARGDAGHGEAHETARVRFREVVRLQPLAGAPSVVTTAIWSSRISAH